MRGEPLSVAGAFDDDLVAGVGESVEGAVAEDGIVEEAEPFLHGPVGGDDEAGDAVSADDQLVEVGGLLGGEPVEAEVVEDEQVWGEERAECAFHGVVDPGLRHGLEEVVSMDEADGVSGADGGVAQGLCGGSSCQLRRGRRAGRARCGRGTAGRRRHQGAGGPG